MKMANAPEVRSCLQNLHRGTMGVISLALVSLATLPATAQEVRTAVLRVDYPALLPLSRLDLPVEDLGLAGARVGTEDNATTGRFMGQTHETVTRAVPPEDLAAAFDGLVADGIRLFVVLGRKSDLLTLADAAPGDALILNAGSGARSLRSEDCRANLLHIAPSEAMRADALVQFLVWKKWTDLFLVREGFLVNVKVVKRLYREERLWLRRTKRKKIPRERRGGAPRDHRGPEDRLQYGASARAT